MTTAVQTQWQLRHSTVKNPRGAQVVYTFTNQKGMRLEFTAEDVEHTVEKHIRHLEPGSRFKKGLDLTSVLEIAATEMPSQIRFRNNHSLVQLHTKSIIGTEGIASAEEMKLAGVLEPSDTEALHAVQKEVFQRNIYDSYKERKEFVRKFNASKATGRFRLGIREQNIVNLFLAKQFPTRQMTIVIGKVLDTDGAVKNRIRTVYPGRAMTRLPADPPISYTDIENPTRDLKEIYECWKDVGFLIAPA